MATKTTTTLTDDLDGSPADKTVSYSWDGQAYEIDLSSHNAEEFSDAVAPYLAASRKAGAPASGDASRRARRTSTSSAAAAPAGGGDVDAKAVRAWAEANGVAVSPRGRLSSTVIEQYRAAQ